jgi:hypothetical protein
MVGPLCGWLLALPVGALATPPEPPEEVAPAVPATDPVPGKADWLEDRRTAVEQELGEFIDTFDRFFPDQRNVDVESPASRLRLRTFARTAQDQHFAAGAGVAASVHLPRLQEWLGNARLVLEGENSRSGAALPPAGNRPPDGAAIPSPAVEADATDMSRRRGGAEFRFDLFRSPVVVVDVGEGVTFAWPPIPFTRLRGHLRLALGAGFVLRGTEALFVELGSLGPGTSTDLLVERFLWTVLRLRWEGHGFIAWHTRGIEWNTLVGAEWKVHRRTGLYAGVGANGFGTPSPGMDAWRTWIGVRQDIWHGWVFAELEPQLAWPRLAGQPRGEALGITLRLELVLDARPSVIGASR